MDKTKKIKQMTRDVSFVSDKGTYAGIKTKNITNRHVCMQIYILILANATN